MPTYDYKCRHCDETESVFQSIGEYSRAPIRPQCDYCKEEMERKLSVVPGVMNALAGDRHYDGLRATDGADISTRTKHREYMKSKGLTMASDYTQSWKDAAVKRERVAAGEDPTRKAQIREIVEKAIQS